MTIQYSINKQKFYNFNYFQCHFSLERFPFWTINYSHFIDRLPSNKYLTNICYILSSTLGAGNNGEYKVHET